MRGLIGVLLICAGFVACLYAAIIWIAIPRSDTATSSLIWFGMSFAIPGLAALVAGAWLRRASERK